MSDWAPLSLTAEASVSAKSEGLHVVSAPPELRSAIDDRSVPPLSSTGGHGDAGMTFFELYVNTPLEICEEKDPKGLYAKARAGDLPNFTGTGAEYEVPTYPDLELTPACGEIFEQALRAAGLLSEINQV